MELQEGLRAYEVDLGGVRLSFQYEHNPSATSQILFVHGLASSRDSFRLLFDRPYFPQASLLLPDLIGFGDSSKPAGFSYTMEDQAAICDQLLSLLPALPLHIAAHSMGNAVALLLSPRTLIGTRSFANIEGNLIGADCGFSRSVASLPFEEYQGRIFGEQQAEFRGHPGLRLEQTTATAVYRSSQSLVRLSDSGALLARFQGLACRKCYIYGDQNAGMPILQQLGGIQSFMIPRSGHGMMVDNAAAFYTQLADFVQ